MLDAQLYLQFAQQSLSAKRGTGLHASSGPCAGDGGCEDLQGLARGFSGMKRVFHAPDLELCVPKRAHRHGLREQLWKEWVNASHE